MGIIKIVADTTEKFLENILCLAKLQMHFQNILVKWALVDSHF